MALSAETRLGPDETLEPGGTERAGGTRREESP
jgi:hypothetical protein